ncbi:sodium/hydrogen exchanger 9B2-like isoform X2 [Macrosteles quadrilineatus]|uniref:sodium/hydrogen exchanger 9B2-like isoform X2 n=1 Tax=Macrosteles quadrilineatus TaxID=74068 RepID=UPI0023E10D76|nr:sodium/hydrogen exchanger 9B2-like isoform X2 [Macrosteles quadrilineatus]
MGISCTVGRTGGRTENQKNATASKDPVISIIDTPAKVQENSPEENSPNRPWYLSQLEDPCGCANSWTLQVFGLLVFLALLWGLLYSLVHNEVTPSGDLFKILVLVLLAFLAGKVVALVRLPPLLGMLITGIALRTSGFYQISGVYVHVVVTLREVALSVILIKAGLGLDPVALLKLSLVVIRLAICPCIAEAVGAAVVSHYILGYPWLWGLLLGFLLSAVSPAVVVPVLLGLQERGYGESKGIATLVIAASSMDDVLAISIYGICLSMIFSTGNSDISRQLLQGPLEMLVGLAIGIAWGLLTAVIPHRNDKLVVLKRSVMIGAGGLCAILGAEMLEFPGAGPLACITASFVGCLCWKHQGWDSHNPVSTVFGKVWLLLQPMLFGLIGAEIDLNELRYETISSGLLVIFGALVVRIICCCFVLLGGKLNMKEVLFVNLAWLPKATVQAALAPDALDMVRKSSENPDPIDIDRGEQILTIAVLSILVTAPLGSIGITLGGPHLLSQEHPESTSEQDKSHSKEKEVAVEKV